MRSGVAAQRPSLSLLPTRTVSTRRPAVRKHVAAHVPVRARARAAVAPVLPNGSAPAAPSVSVTFTHAACEKSSLYCQSAN
jgi:hypothetical protein